MTAFMSGAASAPKPCELSTKKRQDMFVAGLANLGSPARNIPWCIDEMGTRATVYLAGNGEARVVMIIGEDSELLCH